MMDDIDDTLGAPGSSFEAGTPTGSPLAGNPSAPSAGEGLKETTTKSRYFFILSWPGLVSTAPNPIEIVARSPRRGPPRLIGRRASDYNIHAYKYSFLFLCI